jgi:hypothetical protein
LACATAVLKGGLVALDLLDLFERLVVSGDVWSVSNWYWSNSGPE